MMGIFEILHKIKKVAAVICCGAVVFSTQYCFGQSTFIFSNYVPSAAVDAPVFDAQGNRLQGATFLAQLWGGPTPDSLQPIASSTVPFLTGLESGYFRHDSYVIVPGVARPALASLQVRAWDTRLGATYDAVRGLGRGGYGESILLQAIGGDPLGGVVIPPEPLVGLQSFSLREVIPEPSPLLLLLLGLPWLYLRSRRDK